MSGRRGIARGRADHGAWLALRGEGGAAEDTDALMRVRAFIDAYGKSRFPRVVDGETIGGRLAVSDTGRITISRAGFRQKVSRDTAFLFFPKT